MPDPCATLRLINETNRDRLVVQRDAVERVETKGTIVLGFGVAALQFLLTQDGLEDGWRALAFLAYGIAFLFGLYLIAPFRFNYPPEPSRLFNKYAGKPEHEVLDALAATRATAFERNAKKAKRKGVAWWVTLLSVMAAVLFSGFAFANRDEAVMGTDGNGKSGNGSVDQSPAEQDSSTASSTDEDLFSFDNRSWEPETEEKAPAE